MKIGYLFSRYLHLSETFILREMWELEQMGHRVQIYPLLRHGGRQHPRATQLRAPVYWTGWGCLGSHGYWLRRRPGEYLRTLVRVLWENRSDRNLLLGAICFWGKAVAIARHAQQSGVERVHAHYATHPTLVAYIVRRLAGIPYTFTVHAHDIYCHRAMLAAKVGAADFVVAISTFNQDWIARAVPPPRPPVYVIHCGIEGERYAAIAALRPASPEPGLRILNVGTLTASKGQRYLVDACAGLQAGGIAFECRIAGEGDERGRLQEQIHQLDLEAVVTLTGPATEADVLQALAWANVFVLPSIRMANGKMEGLPVALMEAMASGLPVVASNLSGIPELVQPGRTGVLVSERDAAGLAAALRELADPGRRRQLGQCARERMESDFELAANVTRLAALWGTQCSHEVAA